MRKQLQMFGILIAFNKGFDHKRVCGPHGNIVGIATEIALIYRSETAQSSGHDRHYLDLEDKNGDCGMLSRYDNPHRDALNTTENLSSLSSTPSSRVVMFKHTRSSVGTSTSAVVTAQKSRGPTEQDSNTTCTGQLYILYI